MSKSKVLSFPEPIADWEFWRKVPKRRRLSADSLAVLAMIRDGWALTSRVNAVFWESARLDRGPVEDRGNWNFVYWINATWRSVGVLAWNGLVSARVIRPTGNVRIDRRWLWEINPLWESPHA